MDYLKANHFKYMRRNSDTVLSKTITSNDDTSTRNKNNLIEPIQKSKLLLPFHAQVSTNTSTNTTMTPQSPTNSLNSQSSPVSPSSPSPSLKSNKSLLNQKLFNLVNRNIYQNANLSLSTLAEPCEEDTQKQLKNKNKSRNLSITSSPKTMLQCFQNINNKIRKRHSVSIPKISTEAINIRQSLCAATAAEVGVSAAISSTRQKNKTIYSSNSKLNSAYNHLSFQTLNLANVPNLLVTHMKNQSTPPLSPMSPVFVESSKISNEKHQKSKKSFRFKQSITSVKTPPPTRRCKRSKSAPINHSKRYILKQKYLLNEITSPDTNTHETNLYSNLSIIQACKYCEKKFDSLKNETSTINTATINTKNELNNG